MQIRPKERLHHRGSCHQTVPTAYALAIICGPKLAIAIARASQDQPPNKGPGSGPGQDRPSHLALPCLAYLASHRPRSPCLHLATTARPPSAAGRRGAPLLLLLVQARRARPMRGEVSQASQDLVSTPILTTTNYDKLRRTTTRRTTTNWLNPEVGISQGILIS